MKIGTFVKLDDGTFAGNIQTLTLDLETALRAVEGSTENAPGFRLYHAHAGTELGAGWVKQAKESGNPYISLELDCPSLTAPLWASLVKDKAGEGYSLYWERKREKNAARGKAPATI
jgi:uncharacterized protein (DUF736 family)